MLFDVFSEVFADLAFYGFSCGLLGLPSFEHLGLELSGEFLDVGDEVFVRWEFLFEG